MDVVSLPADWPMAPALPGGGVSLSGSSRVLASLPLSLPFSLSSPLPRARVPASSPLPPPFLSLSLSWLASPAMKVAPACRARKRQDNSSERRPRQNPEPGYSRLSLCSSPSGTHAVRARDRYSVCVQLLLHVCAPILLFRSERSVSRIGAGRYPRPQNRQLVVVVRELTVTGGTHVQVLVLVVGDCW